MGLIVAAVVATIISFAFGALWYGPFFGKQWMKLQKMKKKDTKPSVQPMVYGLLRHFVTAFVIALIFAGVELKSAVMTVAILWLAFTAMPALADVIWAQKPIKLYAINVLYELIAVVIMALVIVGWF